MVETLTDRQPTTKIGGAVLTERQREVLQLLADNGAWTNKDIGDEMGISPTTVARHLSARSRDGVCPGIFERLGVCSRTMAVMEALRRGEITLNEEMR